MFKRTLIILLLTTGIMASNLTAALVKEDLPVFESLFTEWTEAFNRQDLAQTCGLFSKDLIANYQGIPTKNYSSMCKNFEKIFAEKNPRYQYHFKIQNVYQASDLAVVRITWYLHKYQNGQEVSMSQDEGLDVLKKDAQGQWKIVNYLAYRSDIEKIVKDNR